MSNLLTDLTLTSAHIIGASFADIAGMSDTVTIAGTGSLVILMMSLEGDSGGGDKCAEYRFTHDGARVGPEVSSFADSTDELSGRTLMFALTGLSAGSHTFAVQGANRSGITAMNTAIPRTFQIVEIETGASLLVDLETQAADTVTASFVNMVNLSQAQTPAAGALLLFLHGSQMLGIAGQQMAHHRFAIDGVRDGPLMGHTMDNIDETTGLMMAWAVTGVTAVSHTFSIQWQNVDVFPDMDTARPRVFQVIQFTADADLLVDVELLTADSAPASFADQSGMSGTPSIDSTDSVVLVLGNYTIEPAPDDTADNVFSIGGVEEGAEVAVWTDEGTPERAEAVLMARAVTGEVGATAMSLQWRIRRIGSSPATDTTRERTFQVIDLVTVAANLAGTIPLSLTPTADLNGTGQLAGSSNLVIDPAGTLTALGQLIGSSALILAPAGTLGAQGQLAGAINLIITPAGTIQARGALAGSVDMVLTPTATIQALGALLGSSALVLTPAATIQAQGALSGTIALLLTPAATIQARGELIGTAALILTVDGNLQAIGGNLAGVIPLVLTATGTLAGLGALAGAANLVLTPSGTLQATGGLLGDSTLTLTLAGNLQALGALLGSSDLVLTPAGNLAGKGALAGSADLVLDAAGALGGIGGLAGTIPLTLDAAGALIAQAAIAGSLTMTLTPTGTIRADASIAGSVDLALTVTGALVQIGGLSGTIDMTIDAAGNLVGRGELAGSSDLAIVIAGDLGAQGNLAGSAQLTITADGTLRAVGELQGLAQLALTLAGTIFDQSARRIPNSLQALLVFLQNSRQDLSAGELNSDQSIIAGRLNSEQ